jgi:hypothetical protein
VGGKKILSFLRQHVPGPGDLGRRKTRREELRVVQLANYSKYKSQFREFKSTSKYIFCMAILSSRKHLAMYGDIFDCHNAVATSICG